MSSWIIIKRYSYIHEAEIAHSNLEVAGITARLNNAQTLAVQPFLSMPGQGIELLVQAHQADMAISLLEQDFSADVDSVFGDDE